MHRRTDLWGPDGMNTICFECPIGWLICLLSSTGIRSWSLPGWKGAQIFNPEPLHFLSFQRRTPYLPWTTSTYKPSLHKYKKLRKKPFLLFSVCLSWSHLFPYSPIATVHRIWFGTIWKSSSSGGLGRLWWFEGTEKVVPSSHLTMYIKVSGFFGVEIYVIDLLLC